MNQSVVSMRESCLHPHLAHGPENRQGELLQIWKRTSALFQIWRETFSAIKFQPARVHRLRNAGIDKELKSMPSAEPRAKIWKRPRAKMIFQKTEKKQRAGAPRDDELDHQGSKARR